MYLLCKLATMSSSLGLQRYHAIKVTRVCSISSKANVAYVIKKVYKDNMSRFPFNNYL